jgi:hypothetical protein
MAGFSTDPHITVFFGVRIEPERDDAHRATDSETDIRTMVDEGA